MSLYESLDISDINVSQQEIRKSYYRLAKLYHPDKSSYEKYDQNLKKFKEINLAYEILSNPDTRIEYNNSLKNNETPYNLIMKFINKNKYFDKDLINLLIKKIYGDPENFKNNIKKCVNNYEFTELYNTLFQKDNILDIKYDLAVYLDDIYECKYKKLKIKRVINNKEFYHYLFIPIDPYTEELIYENEGDVKNNDKGDIIINLILNNDSKIYEILDNYNLLIKTHLFNSMILPNSDVVNKNVNNIIFKCNEYEIYKYTSKGLLNIDIDKRGDLYIKNYIN